MSPHRMNRIDANQKEIVKALRAAGATVLSLAPVGKGCPDLMVGWQGKNLLLEVKDGSKPPSARKLTPLEAEWVAGWKGQVAVVESIEDALSILAPFGAERTA